MSDFQLNFGGDSIGDEDENSEDWQFGGRNATIYLIDCAPQMFAATEGESHFVTAMKCAHAGVCSQVVSSDQDLTSIILFNVESSKDSDSTVGSYPHIATLLSLARPSADRVLLMEKYMKDGVAIVKTEFGGLCENATIYDSLWCCHKIFNQCPSKLNGRNILLFTCRDSPHSTADVVKRAVVKARDLNDCDIDIELLTLGLNFNLNGFYKELLTLGGEFPERAPVMAPDRLEELQEKVRRLESRQRTTGRLMFKLTSSMKISVGYYTAIRKATKPSKQKLHSSTNEEVKAVTTEYLEETGELVMKSDFVKYQTYGNKNIKLTMDESRQLMNIYPSGIQLLGFKPISLIHPDHYVKPAGFIFPDDVNVKGSMTAFAALLSRCHARKIVPIVRIVIRANSAPMWAALLPQLEEVDDNGGQITPSGFHVCYLPFADDFRTVDLEKRPLASSDQIDLAKSVIKKLSFSYHPSVIPNPDLQTHWRNVEALALNRSELEPVIDYTVPDYEKIREKAGERILAFKDSVFPEGYDPKAVKKAPAVRKAPTAAKVTSSMPQSVELMATQKKVDKLTVAVLKEWLQEKGVVVAAKKKPQLVQDVYDYLAS